MGGRFRANPSKRLFTNDLTVKISGIGEKRGSQRRCMPAQTFGPIAVDDIEPESYRTIVRAWNDQRGDAPFPPKEKIDPFVVPALAANIILYEVAGKDLIYRIIGEKVLTAVGTKLRGHSLREAFGNTPYVDMIERQLHECVASGVPLYSRHDFQLAPAAALAVPHARKAWRIALPYGEAAGENKGVTRLLCYQLFSQTIEVAFKQDIDFAGLMPTSVFKIRI